MAESPDRSASKHDSSDPTVGTRVSAEQAPGTRIEISNLTVQVGDRCLLDDASTVFESSDITLILGCSGVGKSILLRILAGLISPAGETIRYDGSIRFLRHARSDRAADASTSDGRLNSGADHDQASHSEASQQVAVVFQNFALLDELTPLQNVRMAIDHTHRHHQSRNQNLRSNRTEVPNAAELLQELGVPTDRPTAVLSGGQRQRLAIARAIATNADVILYDEPTSGLDVRTARHVAQLIQQTQQRHQRTSIIVTHDYESLQKIAGRIILFDHLARTLTDIPRSEWHRLGELLGDPPPVTTAKAADPPSFGKVAITVLKRIATATGQTIEELALLPWALLPLWRSVRWGLRYTRHYLTLVAGPSACAYIAVSGMIIGFVAQDFIFRYLPFRQFTEPLLTENLLHATGFSLFRFLVPILSTILISARSGAAVAADVGSKVYGNQLDAMKTIGVVPERILRTPILYAFLIGTPLLSLLSYAVASVTAASAFLLTHQDAGIAFWDAHFHRYLKQSDSFFYEGTDWLILKLLTCGVGIALISWRCGISPKQSGPDISRGVTQTILWATLFTLAVHFAFSLLEFQAPT
ncbi:MAG: ATP-binding cassette domain-containing protein [Planctomyces sp.]